MTALLQAARRFCIAIYTTIMIANLAYWVLSYVPYVQYMYLGTVPRY